MNNNIFLASASGAIGRVLTPMLVSAGFDVFGTTKRQAHAEALEKLGVVPSAYEASTSFMTT